MRDCDNDEFRDSREVGRIAGVQREPVGDGGRRYQSIVSAGGGLPPGVTKGRGDPPEGPGGTHIKRQGVKVRLGLLKV